MAITKTGRRFTGPLAWAVRKAGPAVKKVLWGSRHVPGGAYRGARYVGGGVASAAGRAGEAAVKHPQWSIPAIGLGGAAVYNAKGNFKKNWLHTDPSQNLTYAAPLSEAQGRVIWRPGAIKFKDPRMAEFYASRQSDHTLY